MSIPTLNVYQGGEVVKTIVGAKPKAAIEGDLASSSPQNDHRQFLGPPDVSPDATVDLLRSGDGSETEAQTTPLIHTQPGTPITLQLDYQQ
jgi:hypothetical protein